MVGLDIEGKGPQAGGQQGQELLGGGQGPGQGQVEQHGGGGRYKRPRRPQVGGCLRARRQKFLHFVQGKPGVLDLFEGEIGIGVDQAGGQPRPQVRAGEVGPRRPRRFLRLAGEVVILRPGNVPPGAGFHGPYRSHARSRLEGGVHQRHQCSALQNTGGLLQFGGRLGALGLFRVGGDGPGLPELLRAGYVTGGAVVLHHPGGKVPFSRGLQHGEVFHGIALQRWFFTPYYIVLARRCKMCLNCVKSEFAGLPHGCIRYPLRNTAWV